MAGTKRFFKTETKRFFSVILMSLFLCVCFLFGGCAKEMEGTYKFSKMTYTEGGMEIELEAGEKFMGMVTLSEDFITITLHADGTATMSTFEEGATATLAGTWKKVDGENIEITVDGEAQTCKCDGKTITMQEDGATIVLKK